MHWLPIAYGLLVLGIASAIVSTTAPGDEEVRAVIRATAFTSAVPFLLVFVASPWHRLRPSRSSRWLLANRRYVGLSVAASHLWHLAAIVALVTGSTAFRQHLNPATLIFGGAGFTLLALMAATSTDGAQRSLGRTWGWLHTTGLYVLWLDFTFTYVGRATVVPFHAVMTAAFVVALGLRVTGWALPRRARRRPPLEETPPLGRAG